MKIGRRLWLVPLSAMICACNMVMSEAPVFTDADRASVVPRDGVWLGDDEECPFDSTQPESIWPRCALWVIVRQSGAEMHLADGKGESQRVGGLFAAGTPAVIQGEWVDEAKEPRKAYYAFYGFEPHDIGGDGRFASASVWPVECGIQDEPNGDIEPFPGISPECRPTTKESVHAAAGASRRPDQVKRWRWIRQEAP